MQDGIVWSACLQRTRGRIFLPLALHRCPAKIGEPEYYLTKPFGHAVIPWTCNNHDRNGSAAWLRGVVRKGNGIALRIAK